MAEFHGELECDVTEYVPPQVLPPGAEVYGEVTEYTDYDEEFGRVKMLIHPISVANAPEGFNVDGPVSPLPFYIYKLDKTLCVKPDGTFNENMYNIRLREMHNLKAAFGVGKTENLSPRQHCAGKRVRCIVKEQYAKPEKKAERAAQGLDPFVEVGRWLEVEGVNAA